MFPVQIVARNFEGFAESLEMHNFPFPQEAQRGKHFGVIRHINKIFIGTAGFLLCCTFANANFRIQTTSIYGIIYAKKRRKAKRKKDFIACEENPFYALLRGATRPQKKQFSAAPLRLKEK